MREPELKSGEMIEGLQYKGLRIIQNDAGFRFGTDSVLLAAFVHASAKDRIVDLGTGTGVIAILLNGRTGAKLTGVEIQPEQCNMARRSVDMNAQDIPVIEADMRTVHGILGRGAFDIAVCNPPYYSKTAGKLSQKGEGEYEGAATHDLYCTMDEVAKSADNLLKFGGKFVFCCPASRLAEAFAALNARRLEPKRLRLVASMEGKPPYLALIEAKKGAAPGLIIEKQLTVCNSDGSYTEEVNAIYHRESADE